MCIADHMCVVVVLFLSLQFMLKGIQSRPHLISEGMAYGLERVLTPLFKQRPRQPQAG